MTVLVTPTNGPWAATLNIPADGETINSAGVLAYVQEIANRLEFLRQRVPAAVPNAGPMTIGKPMGEALIAAGSTNWQVNFTASSGPVVNNLVITSTEVFLLTLDQLVPGSVIRTFNALLRGAAAHAALPAVMPKVELVKYDLTTVLGTGTAPGWTVVDTVSDTAASTAAYQLNHLITKTLAAPQTVGVNDVWALRMTGESGANSLVGLQWVAGAVTLGA